MKWLILLSLTVLLSGCQTRTKYGDCVGVSEHQSSKLQYKLSVRNTVVGIIFVETVFVPVVVLVNKTYCPVGPKVKNED
jgi:hypothetical protein